MRKKQNKIYSIIVKEQKSVAWGGSRTRLQMKNWRIWNTQRTEKLSKLTAKKERLKQKLAGMSELKLQEYYDRQAKMKEGRDKWLVSGGYE